MKRSGWFISFALTVVLVMIAFATPASALEFGVRGYYWFPKFSTDFKVDGLNQIGTELNDNILNLDRDYIPSVEAYVGIGKNHLSLMYTPVKYSGNTHLTQQIIYQGQTYNPGDYVETNLDFTIIDLEYQRDLINVENLLAGFSFGPILKVKYLDGSTELNAPIKGADYDLKEKFQIPIPMIGLGAHIGVLTNILEARAKITGIGYSGNWVYEGLAEVSWTPFPFLDLSGGYKFINVDIDYKDTYLKANFTGPYVALTIGF
ncbi:MAG: hypothetical protein ABSB79_04485 [Syntrophales bacterium]|jgi:hypothetical protein